MGALWLLALLTLISPVLSQYNKLVDHERNCPDDWKFFDFKCYKEITSAGTYEDIRDKCLSYGADLPVYDYRMEMFHIEKWQTSPVNQWCGAEVLENGVFTWVDGRKESSTYTRWADGEPDEFDSDKFACKHSGTKLEDELLTSSLGTTCEMRANTVDAQLPRYCASQTEIRALAKPIIMSSNPNPDRTRESCATACLEQEYSYSARLDGVCVCMNTEPNTGTCNDPPEHNVYFEFTTADFPDNFSMSISQPTNMDCEEPSHVYYNGSCYIYVSDQKSFDAHQTDASEMTGGRVVAINTEAEARFIDEVLLGDAQRDGDNLGHDFFVGVKIKHDGSSAFVDYENTDGESLSWSYSRWGQDQGGSDTDLGCAYHKSEDKMWYNVDCSLNKGAIYEYSPSDSQFQPRGSSVEMFTPVEATFDHVTGPISENSVDFGYDGQFDWDTSSTSFTHYTRDLGEQEVLFDSMDFWYQRANGSATYSVVLPTDGSYVKCPPIVDTTYGMECEVAGTGEGPVDGTIDWGDSSTVETFNLEGSTNLVVGPNIRRRSSSTGQTVDGKSVVMVNSMFSDLGLIQAFEFDVAEPGDFKFVVWRPRCLEEETYCSKSMTCEMFFHLWDTCENATNAHAVDCGSNKWSLSQRSCVDPAGNKVAPAGNTWTSIGFNYLDEVGSFSITTSRRGRHFSRLSRDEMIKVEPGDFLGFIGQSGMLADAARADWTAYSPTDGDDASFPSNPSVNPSVNHFDFEFFVNAHVTKFHPLIVPHQYTDPANITVTFTTSNNYSSSDVEATFDLDVYILVENVTLISPEDGNDNFVEVNPGQFVITQMDTWFKTNDHIGEPKWYAWEFGDGNNITTRSYRVVHQYAEPGRYNATVRVYNELSWQFDWVPVLAQANITQGFYTQADNSTRLGRQTVLEICIDDGNEVFYSLTVDDGTIHPGVVTYEDTPHECIPGWTEKNRSPTDPKNPLCYRKADYAGTYDDGNSTCSIMYNRSRQVYYETQEHFKNVYTVHPDNDLLTGYQELDIGENGEEHLVWHDVYGQPLEKFPPWGSSDVGVSEGNDHCATISGPDGVFERQDCDDTSRHSMCIYEGRCQTFSVVINQIGFYYTTLKAWNEVSQVNHTFIHYVENPILNLYIHPIPSVTWGDVIVLNITWTSGSNLTAYCFNSYDGTGDPCDNFTYHEGDDGLAGYGTIIVNKTEYIRINEHYRYVLMVNKISRMVAKRNFTVMYAIEELELKQSHTCTMTREWTVKHTLTAKQMSHATIDYSYNDGSDDMVQQVYIPEMTEDENHPFYPEHQLVEPKYLHEFFHEYPYNGTFTLVLNVSNDVSWATINHSIVVENPIRGYRLNRTTPVPIWPGQVATVTYTLIFDNLHEPFPDPRNLSLNPHRVATAVTQLYKYGHPNCSRDDTQTTLAATTPGTLKTTPDMWMYQGEKCPEAMHFEEVWVNETVNDVDTYDYLHYGTFPIYTFYENCISNLTFEFTIDVDQPVINLTIESDNYILPWMDNTTLTMNMDWGSRINLTYDFNDTNPVYTAVYDRLYPNFILHTWDVVGTFYPTITAVNLLDTYVAVCGPLYVQYILDNNLYVETPYIWTIPYPSYTKEVSFYIYLLEAYKDMMPTNVTANISFGEPIPLTGEIAVRNNIYLPDAAVPDSSLHKVDDRHAWTPKYDYTIGGTYNVTFDLANWVSNLSFWIEFHAIEEIAPVTWNIRYWDVDVTSMESWPDKDLAIDWEHYVHEFVYCDLLWEMYPDDFCFHALRKLLGVWDDTDPSIDTSIVNNETSTYKRVPTNDNYRPPITHEYFLQALNHSIILLQEEIEILVADAPNIRRNLTGDDLYKFEWFLKQMELNPPLNVSNVDSIDEKYFNLDVYHDWLVKEMWNYNKAVIGDDLVPGHSFKEDTINSYPIEKAVEMYLDFARGSHLSFRWWWGDGADELSWTPYANHRYAIPGQYNVTVVAFNAISFIELRRTINIERSVFNLSITGLDQISRNMTNSWDLDLGNVGTDACYQMDFKDEGTEEIPVANRYFFMGNKDACQSKYPSEMAKAPLQFIPFTNEHLEKEKEEKGTFLVTISFMYGSVGTFKATLTGINRVSSEVALIKLAVTKGPCFSPLVLLAAMNPCEPLCIGENNEKGFYKSKAVDLFSAVNYNCTTTKLAYHYWQMYSVDDDGLETPYTPPNITMYASYDEIPLRRLILPPRMLEYGRYKMTLNITMYDETIWFMDTMYFHVVKSPLKLSINSATPKVLDRYKFAEKYVMDAASYTYDPDYPENTEGFVFRWQCRRSCETFPEYSADYSTIVTPMTSVCEEHNKTYFVLPGGEEEGGCFINDGYASSGLITSSTEGYFEADLTYAYELDMVEIMLTVYKDDRYAVMKMYLEITQGMPPQIDPDLCVSNCKEKVNYEEIYSLTAKVDGIEGFVYNYRWFLYKGPVDDFADPSVVEIPKSEWNNNLPEIKRLEGKTMVETGDAQQSLALEPGFFTIDDLDSFFFVSVMVWRGNNYDNFGVAVNGFQVNEPPTLGNCTVYPLNGTAALTKFNVNCTEFYDQHKPVKYQMGTKVVGTENIQWGNLRPTASDPTGGKMLPQGDPSYDYQVEVYVRAVDSIGARTMTAPMMIEVLAAEINFAGVDVNELSSGDPAAFAESATAIVGGLNVASSPTPVEVVDFSTMTEEEIAEYEAEQEEVKLQVEAEKKEFREKLLGAFATVPITSLEDLTTFNQAASSVAGNTDEMTENSVDSVVAMGASSLAVLGAQAADLDQSAMTEYSTSILTGQASGAVSAAKIAASEGTSPEAAARKRKRRAAGLPTTDELTTSIQDTLGTLASLVDGVKVAGEGDTTLVTAEMSMTMMKQFAGAFGDGKLASTGDGVNGVALPPGDALTGSGNNSVGVVSSQTNNYNKRPFTPATLGNSTDYLPTSKILQIVLKDESGNSLNTSSADNSTEPPPVSHIFMSRDSPPEPLISTNMAVKLGDVMAPHKIGMPKQNSIHVKMRRTYLTGNNTVNGTNATGLPPLLSSGTTLDPFVVAEEENKTNVFFKDKSLVFFLFFREIKRPSFRNYDFKCILPITYYDLNHNTTVAIGGAVRTETCDSLLADNENGTCERHTLNRDIYPPHKDIVENDDMTCYIPNTWLNSYDAPLELYIGVSYLWIDNTNISLTNTTYEEFVEGYEPEFVEAEIPDEFYEDIYYEMEVQAASCQYWSPFYEDYVTDGCEVGPLTTANLTQCMCGLLSPPVPEYDEEDESITPEEYERKTTLAKKTPGVSFGSGVSIPFNTIDPSNSAFNNLGENPLIFSIMVSIICLYLCLIIWAVAQDRKDAIKAGVSPLLDNDPRDRYLYEVTVYTGSRSGSGTTAKVSMIFSGDEDETPPRLFFDDKRDVLQAGGVDGFVMATPRCLGSMSHIRVWHDNSGKSPGWFFSRMQVVDMQTLEKYFFILDRWLSAGEDDGIVDRVVPLAGKDELTGFSHLFFTKARKDLMDGHIWFSVVGKPHKSNFSRVQRLTCCLALLFASMAGNIMFYQSPTEDQQAKSLRLGPISLTYSQLISGILSSAVAFPINILIVLIFKNSKEPPYDLGKRCCSPCKKNKTKKKNVSNFAADELAHQAKILDSNMRASRVASFASLRSTDSENEAINNYISEETRKRNRKYKLPWGFIFVAYFLSLGLVVGSFYYTVEVGGTFGPKKSAEWIGAFAMSVVESIFFSQPIKVLGLALFWALVIRKPESDDDVDPGLEKGEEYMHKHEKQSQKLSHQARKKLNKYKNVPVPPTEEYLQAARKLRQKELKMMSLLWELFLYIIFVYLVFMVSFGNRDPAAYSLYSSLYNEFHEGVYVPDDGIAMSDVTEYNSFWKYCEETLLPSLWPEPWYDGVARYPKFTADRNMYRVGVPRLRQLRMPSEECGLPMWKYTKECNNEYSLFGEDTGNYYPGWIPVTNVSDPSYGGPYPGWHWQSSSDLDGFPFQGEVATYGGGGFSQELGHSLEKARKNLAALKENEWLTPETRAVVVEFVLYNSNMNLYAVSTITFEFLYTGSVVPVYKMHLIRLDRYIGTYMITVLVAELLTCIYVIYFLVRECKAIKALGKKYFESFWNCMEVVQLLLCFLAISMYFARFALVKRTSKAFRADPRSFVSFQFASVFEEVYGYILAIIIFCATVKFLKLLRFNKKMTMLGMTMMYIGKPLLSFLFALGIVFIAFAQMAFLVYCRLLLSFSTFIKSSFTLFTLMLNKFDYKELEEANPVFAAVIFISFTIIVSFMLLSFMITIILEGFSTVTEELREKENQYEIVDFMVSKFKGLVGFGKGPDLPPMNNQPDGMISETHNELMERMGDFDEMFRDFCADETRGDESLVYKFEKQILAARKAAKNKTIYSTD